jgi:transposase InsO family protein
MIESFWSTMQRELLDTRTVWDTPEQLGAAIFEWIEAWYNPRRRHTALGMLSPIDYEHHWQQRSLHTTANGAA